MEVGEEEKKSWKSEKNVTPEAVKTNFTQASNLPSTIGKGKSFCV